MASLKQIAADLGVSHGLVSRVLSNRMGNTGVKESTKAAILKRAEELEYRPNSNASALKRGFKGMVGVFLHEVGCAGTELNLKFIESAASSLIERGLHLWVQIFAKDDEFLAACTPTLLRRIDGLIVAGNRHQGIEARLKEMELHGLHVVGACHGAVGDGRIQNFQVAQETQGYLPARHLIEIGCRDIAHIATLPSRHQGFITALEKAGIRPNPRLMLPAPAFTRSAGYEAMRQLLSLGASFDGLVAQSDAQAAGAMYCLLEQNVPRSRWPKITGVDNSPIATDYCAIPLTSVTAEMEATAEMAVAAIAAKIEGNQTESALIQPKLVIRQSTVP